VMLCRTCVECRSDLHLPINPSSVLQLDSYFLRLLVSPRTVMHLLGRMD
jgi:hypothetical protein